MQHRGRRMPGDSRSARSGKVIKRGWDWLGITPDAPDLIGGLVEAPGLAASLTLNKADFLRTGPRGAVYLSYRKALQEAVSQQLAEWGGTRDGTERARSRAARPVERDVESVLLDLAESYHLALAVAMALAKVAVEPAQEHDFIAAFLGRWGEAAAGKRKVRRRRAAR